jgi:hypothetical protein
MAIVLIFGVGKRVSPRARRYLDGRESKTTYMLDLSKRCPDEQ